MRQEPDNSYQWNDSSSDKINYLPSSPSENSQAEMSSSKIQYRSGSNLCSKRLSPSPELGSGNSQNQFGEPNFFRLQSGHITKRKISIGSDISLVHSSSLNLDGSSSDEPALPDEISTTSDKYDEIVEGMRDFKFLPEAAADNLKGVGNVWKDSHEGDNHDDDDDDDDDDLQERGPMRSQTNFSRSKPYYGHGWLEEPTNQDSQDYSLDFESTAKQILNNIKYSFVMNATLDQLTDCNENQRNCINSERAGKNFESYSGVSNNTTDKIPFSSTSKVDCNENHESLIDILKNLQPAQPETDNLNSSSATSSENWPDSPTSSYQIPSSRSQSGGSSRAQSPGSSVNIGSPIFSANFSSSPPRQQQSCNYRAGPLSTSSSSDYSYGDTSSPVNDQNALDPPSLGNFSTWCGNCESSGTVFNSADIIDDQFKMANEVIRHDPEEMQVVPKCRWEMKSSEVDMNKSEEWNYQKMGLSNSISNIESSEKLIDDIQNHLLDPDFNSSYDQNSEFRPYFLDLETKMEDLISSNYSQQNIQNVALDDDQNSDNQNCQDSYNSNNIKPITVKFHKENIPQFLKIWNEDQPSTSKNQMTFDNFQIPKSVPQQKSSTLDSRKTSSRSIAPWSSLNLPQTPACEILKNELDPVEVEKAMRILLMKSVHDLSIPDEDGDTFLMYLVGNPTELEANKAYLIPLVERLGTLPGALSKVNHKGENALYLAAMNCSKMAYVTGYLAAIMIRKGIDITLPIQTRGDNLIHAVAANGDSHKSVLSELLSLKNIQGNSVFDLSKCDYNGRTPLHVAVETHNPVGFGINSISTVRLLLENGADPKIKEFKNGDTALHRAISLSCDPELVQVLLERNGLEAVNIPNRSNNTPLHMAAAVSDRISEKIQKDVCVQLMKAGALTNVQNNQGLSPLELVSSHRKEIIRFFKSKS